MKLDNNIYLVNKSKLEGGIQYEYSFPNGYGASVIKTTYSYGGNAGLWELAVLYQGEICYTSGITEDVIGHLTSKDVKSLLEQIYAIEV
jgi:hypothetical protein